MECFILAPSCHSFKIIVSLESPSLTTEFIVTNQQVIFLHIKVLIFYISPFFLYIFMFINFFCCCCLLVVYISRICSMSTETVSFIKCLAILAHNKYLLNEE